MEKDNSQPTLPPTAENNANHLILKQRRRNLVPIHREAIPTEQYITPVLSKQYVTKM